MLRWMWLAWAVALLAPLAWAEQDDPPPLWPGSDKRLSVNVGKWMLPIVKRWLPNDGVARIVRYVEQMPGDVKARFLKLNGFPKPSPEDVAAFYQEWAERAGYRLVVELRGGEPPPPNWPESNHRPHLDPGLKVDYDPETYYWADAYHRPSSEGGVFLWVWVNHRIYWIWAEGYIPIGPVLGEFLGLPRVPVDMTPPQSVPPMESLHDEGPCDSFFVRTRLGSYEIGRVAQDLSLRVERAEEPGPMETLFAVSPALLAPVRAAAAYTYDGTMVERQARIDRWLECVDTKGWPKLGEGHWDGADVAVWAEVGPDGGAVITLEVDDTATVVVLDGGPNLLVLLPVLGNLKGADGAATAGPP